MAITYVGSTTARDTTSVSMISGVQSGDVIISLYTNAVGVASDRVPTGFSQIFGDSNGCRVTVGYELISGTPDSTIDGLVNSTNACYIFAAFRSVDTTTPQDATATTATGTGSMPNPPSITTVTNNAWVIALGGIDAGTTGSAQSGYTLVSSYQSSGANATAMMSYKEVTSAGAEDPAVFGGAGSDDWVAGSVALRPIVSTNNNGFFALAR